MKDRVSCEIRVGFNCIGREWVGINAIDTNQEDRWGDLGESIAYALHMAAEVQELRVLAEAIISHCVGEDDPKSSEDRVFMHAAIEYLNHLNKEVERLNGNS